MVAVYYDLIHKSGILQRPNEGGGLHLSGSTFCKQTRLLCCSAGGNEMTDIIFFSIGNEIKRELLGSLVPSKASVSIFTVLQLTS